MRFLVKAFILAIPAVLAAHAAQGPVAASAHHAGVPAAAARSPMRPAAAGRRVVNSNAQNPYGLPQAALVGHPELQGHAAGFTGIRSGAYSNTGRYYYGNSQGNRDHRRGFVPPYAYYSTPFLPFFDYGDYYDSNGQDSAAADAASAQAQDAAVTANMLGDQVEHLSAEVESLRNQQQLQPVQPAQPPVPPMPNGPYSAPPPQVQDQAPAEPPITVVLKSGRHFQARNYAIMDQTFWDFSTQPAHKIPVTAINVPASMNASSANGAEFPNIQASN